MVSPADILNARILVVDDLEANVLLLEGMLRIAGYTSVESTTDPKQVCELHRKNRYSLILLDLQMPGMDGFQVMEGLKEIEEDGYLPVLVITAQPAHKLRALEAGAKDFVSKPFDWPSCARAFTTFWKCACCTWKRRTTAGCWRRRSGNSKPAAR
jgi:CheY-like chemotaxis protein